MQKTLFFKLLIIGFLMALLFIPLSMIDATIGERMRFREEAVQSIATDSVGSQTLLGPVLVIPYTESWEEEDGVDPVSKKTVIRKKSSRQRHFVFPDELVINGTIGTDERHRGIHKVLVYSGQHALSGNFILPDPESFARSKPGSRLNPGTPFVALGLSDTRGLRNFPAINWGGQSHEFKQGSHLASWPHGLHAPLPELGAQKLGSINFKLDLAIDGIERLDFVPLAKNNQVNLASKWPHPQFGGRFLPSLKTNGATENGFNANWRISALSSNAQQQLLALEHKGEKPADDKDVAVTSSRAGALDSFGVAFIEPVNVYSQSQRAIKYGLLFVALTFAAFFLFEVLKNLPIHPIQYLLVGMALALFFLLLVSLSEHITFYLAYLLASSACVLLIGFYLMYVLHNWRRGFGLGLGLTVLYGVLFGLLQSENNALVMGAILLFAVLAAIMIVTRKVDWYQLGKPVVV